MVDNVGVTVDIPDGDSISEFMASISSTGRRVYSLHRVLEALIEHAPNNTPWGINIEIVDVVFGTRTYHYQIGIGCTLANDASEQVSWYVHVKSERTDTNADGTVERCLFWRQGLDIPQIRSIAIGDRPPAGCDLSRDLARTLPYNHGSLLALLDYVYAQSGHENMFAFPTDEANMVSREAAKSFVTWVCMRRALIPRRRLPRDARGVVRTASLGTRARITKKRAIKKAACDLADLIKAASL
jgi:hypothetical protein